MKKQIASISLVQTAKVAAIIYFILGVLGSVLLLLGSLFGATPGGGVLMAIIAPFLYAFFGFVFVFVGGWIYNQVAKRFGGIEFTVSETRGDF